MCGWFRFREPLSENLCFWRQTAKSNHLQTLLRSMDGESGIIDFHVDDIAIRIDDDCGLP